MGEQPYRIVFTGKLAPGKKPSEAIANLASLYKTSPERIKSLLTRPDVILGKASDIEKAKALVVRLREAGILCAILGTEEKPAPPSGEKAASPAAQVAPETAKPEVTKTVPPSPPLPAYVVELKTAGADISLSPLNCNHLTAGPGGLSTSRVDRPHVGYDEIRALSIFKPSTVAKNFFFIFFARGARRPFITDGNTIAFKAFRRVIAPTLQDSLRNLVSHLREKNPEIILDRATHLFVSGGPPPVYEKDLITLATSFHNALSPKEAGQESATLEETSPQVPREKTVTCPKCGHVQPTGRPDCVQCGLVFRRWNPRAERKTAIDQITAISKRMRKERTSGDVALREADFWITRWGKVFGILLLLGVALPLLRPGKALSETFIIWPWNMMGFGLSPGRIGAMAAFSKKNHYLLWSFVPLTGGILSLGFSFVNRKIFKSTALFTTGFLTFVLLAMVFLREARLLGSPFVPFSISGGLLYLANVLSAGGIAGGVHLARRFPGTALSRWIMGVGGALFGSLTFIPVFAGKGHLSSWPMYLVYLLFFCYAGLGIAGATKTEPNDSFISFSGKTVRAIIPLALLGGLIAVTYYAGPPTRYVLSGGGLLHNASSLIKTACLYLGSSFLMVAGVVSFLELMLIRKPSGTLRRPSFKTRH